ncbi:MULTISPECIES: VOC family protein [Cryobacterium]|jgi:catechol 2,3-dioxygenase-like lactoylglutathione lyase family enzyme|uniref:VOC family protein n=1 Tax=Cryobacterium lyxosi TaxID=1259228 RepID=A0A4R8ZB16_9MICO|nr:MULTISPECIES: VOC family protein [Cryobacterium]TFD22799.1 VOC family protein [Cryobacterium lyxosi]
MSQTEHNVGIVAGFSGFAVTDLDAARTFYAETLGLEVTVEEMGMLNIALPGGAPVIVYPKPDFVPATYTILNFAVVNLNATVDELTERGVEFLRYDGFEQNDKGIAAGTGAGPDIAWFTDPAGNILSVLQNA